MAFDPVNELERYLMAAAADPGARPAFYRALVEQKLFVVREGGAPAREGPVVLSQDERLQIRLIDVAGRPHAPVFSSVERISAVVPTEVGYVAMVGRDLLGVLRGKDLVLNPGSDYGKLFTPQEVEAILDGSIHRPRRTLAVAGTRVLLGQPKEYPHHVTEAVSRFLATRPEVSRAFLAHALIEGVGETPHTMIGIETTGDWERLAEEIGPVLAAATRPGEFVDLVKMKATAPDVIGDYMLRQTRPFYQRRKKWLGVF